MKTDQFLAIYDRVADSSTNTVPLIRQFVLDLAVRGRLVEQNPNDEPASDLLQKIATEKANLTRRKPKRSGDNPTSLNVAKHPPYALPTGWQWTQIANLGTVRPRNKVPDEYEASFVPMASIFAKYGTLHEHKCRRWGDIKKGYTHFAEGDVGLAKITPCFENGKSTVFRNLTGGLGSGTTELHVIRPIFVNSDYIVMYLKSSNFLASGIPRMTGTAGQKRVPVEYFSSSLFPLPPLAEQERIVTKVDELMAFCDQLEREGSKREDTRDRLTRACFNRLSNPDSNPNVFRNHAQFAINNLPKLTARPNQIPRLRQTILDLAVRGRLVEQNPEDEPAIELLIRIENQKQRILENEEKRKYRRLGPVEEPPFELPSSWCWTRIRNVTSDRGQTVPLTQFTYVDISSIDKEKGCVVRSKVLKPHEAPKRARKKASKDDVIYSCTRPYLLNVAIIEDDYEPELIVSTAFAVLNGHGFIVARYLWTVLRCSFMIQQVTACQQGQAYPAINDSKFAALPIPLPPLAEQHRIVTKIDKLMVVCDQLESKLSSRQDFQLKLFESTFRYSLNSLGR